MRQLTGDNLQSLLRYEDRNSMGHSIEARVPFLDFRLVEFVMGLPDDHKIHDGERKRILRLATKGILPEAIRCRMDKLGFVTPEAVWATGELRREFRQRLEQAKEATRGIIGTQGKDHFAAVTSGSRAYDTLFWRLIQFPAWQTVHGLTGFPVTPPGAR